MENKGPGMIAASIVLTTVAFLLFCLRTYAQHLTSSQIHLDEIFLAIGLILTIGLCIETCLCFYWGAGRHLADILATDPDPLVNQRKYWISGYVSVVNWAVAVFVIKLSLLSMYTRIFNTKSTPNRWFRYAVYGVIAYVISSSIAIIFSYIFICTPISFWWEQVNAVVGKPVPPGSCPNMIPRGVACAALNVVSDWLILSLGALGLWDLQMNRKRKLVVFGILGLGSTCCIVSIIRLPMLLSSSMSNDPTCNTSHHKILSLFRLSLSRANEALLFLRVELQSAALRNDGGQRRGHQRMPPGHCALSETLAPHGDDPRQRRLLERASGLAKAAHPSGSRVHVHGGLSIPLVALAP
ncbi:uncharacterized protein LDX57_009722 [Aspergillus melleus]|uniref:uncharacterized protein n=1 Tax=Aspergillus melleus TaxID=138277 RepID=UPI001E8E0502|nr:uncharacterized protein LDX57_009722 [Aspergillus melleus]KAH8432076.1 hypothetical protein LDX57_009722 [Aspergillus melleus]